MAGLATTISIVDRMSGPLRNVNQALDEVVDSMHQVDEVSGQMLDQAVPATQQFVYVLNESQQAAGGLESALNKVFKVATAIAAVKFGINTVRELLEAADAQNTAATQLATVMTNMGMTLEQFNEVQKMTSDLQSTSIYGDETLLAGAAELATYVTDAEALKTVLSTLPAFATGMTGGQTLDSNGMIDIATQLGKVFNGTFDGIAKKGFVLTDQQKEIIKNGTDMEKALAISEIVNESWEGLAENMANTPSGAVAQLKNAWSDVKEVIGNELYPTVNKLTSAISSNLPAIQTLLKGVAYVIEGIINVTVTLANKTSEVFSWAEENINTIQVAIAGIAGTVSTLFAMIYDMIIPFVNFFVNVWQNPLQSVAYLFVDFADYVLNVLQLIAASIDEIFGSNFTTTIKGWRSEIMSAAEVTYGVRTTVESKDLTDALQRGAEWGMGLVDSLSGATNTYDASYLFQNTADNTAEIADNTSSLSESGDEIVKYMRDLAEREAINRFTTAEVKVELGGVTNNLYSDTDLDGFVNKLSSRLEEELSYTAAAYNGDF